MHPHKSVLLNEVVDAFSNKCIKSFIDGTLGLGGHSEALLQAHPEISTFLAIDQDPFALEYAVQRLQPWNEKIKFCQGNFNSIESLASSISINQVDGILLDLGVSSIQLDESARGFSFMKEGPLDMRMNPADSQTAEEIVNCWPEQNLARLFRDYGEEPQWKQAARIIMEARKKEKLQTTRQLVKVLEPLSKWHKRRVHPATLVFQALRIAVNDELGVLKNMLPKAVRLLNPGGRIAIISFHSLEDRIVKDFFRDAASDKVSTSGRGGMFLDKKPELKLISRKAIMPSEEEQSLNPRSRSARLRIAEKI